MVTEIAEEENQKDEEEEEEEEEANEEKEAGPNAVVKVFRFVMKQSYVCALIAMMVSISLATASGPN